MRLMVIFTVLLACLQTYAERPKPSDDDLRLSPGEKYIYIDTIPNFLRMVDLKSLCVL